MLRWTGRCSAVSPSWFGGITPTRSCQVSLDFHRLQPDAIVALLDDAGFELIARLVRAPDPTSPAAQIPQGFLIARKPA